jgi:O-antigen biosynthesis protein WbqP
MMEIDLTAFGQFPRKKPLRGLVQPASTAQQNRSRIDPEQRHFAALNFVSENAWGRLCVQPQSPLSGRCHKDRAVKRAFDFLAAAAGLAVLWPIALCAMLAVRLNSPGPAIFAQTRVGRFGQSFVCYKLRTMWSDTANLPSHEVGKASLTSIGGFLRRSKLDELPQLYNVLCGDMSLVGPRPCLPTQTELIAARQRQGAFDLRPGITGLAQVQGVDMSDPQRLARIDGDYARTRTFYGDLMLILSTITGSGIGLDSSGKV